MARILIAEDEPRLAAFLEKGLRAGGFATTVVADGNNASVMAKDENFDLLILDLGLPGRDGLDVLRDVRASQNKLPVIILTARDDTSDRVAGLEAGADDYIGKPFHFEELVARVRARLRGDAGPREERHQISEGGITLDLRTRWVSAGPTTVELSAREFELLRTFLEHPNQVLSREQLLAHVWGYDYDPGSNVVDVYVGYLRRKLAVRRVRDGARGRVPLPRLERVAQVEGLQALGAPVGAVEEALVHALELLAAPIKRRLDPELALRQRLARDLQPSEAAGVFRDLEHLDVYLGAEDLSQTAHEGAARELVLVRIEVVAAHLETAPRLDHLVAEGPALPAFSGSRSLRVGRAPLAKCKRATGAYAASAVGPRSWSISARRPWFGSTR